jgi:3',5'-cyclic AMP phosphodiesterase CpdA
MERSTSMSTRDERALGRYLFSIAIVADTHMNETEDASTSPYECNQVANARTRYVVARLNQLRPELTIHLGDLVHPVPSQPTYGQAARNFKELTDVLRHPLHLVPGNHDVGDKPVVWAPAGTVNDAALALWTEHFGAHYYAFDFRDLRFVVIDAQIINSGLASEAEQRAWLERELAASAGRRTFLCTHYPPYVTEPHETESYDNVGEPGRAWLLGLIERWKPEAVFCGHVHNFWYNRHADTDCYILPSTAFVRQDYSELARVAPADQRGRNDLPKLGFFVVKIYESGHVCHLERTYGATLAPGGALAAPRARVSVLHARENTRAPLGVDLRHPWAEVVEVPPTGALDEFERKRSRNDYPLLALWEMGVRKLRVPFQDLEDPRVRERMRDLRALGHEFTVYTLDVPRGRARDILVEHHDVVDVWEVVCSWPEVDRTLAAIRDVKAKAPLTVCLSKLRMKEDVRREGSRYYHFINHGFVVAERDDILASWSAGDMAMVDGLVFRVVRHASPCIEIGQAGEIAALLRARASVHVRMASTNPAEEFTDDLANANRIAEALLASLAQAGTGRPAVDVFIDTFVDIDRGYFVRNGLADRRYNPRLASHVVRNLYAVANASPGPWTGNDLEDTGSGRICTLRQPRGMLALLLPDGQAVFDRVTGGEDLGAGDGLARRIDLATGEIIAARWRREGGAITLPDAVACATPTILHFEA